MDAGFSLEYFDRIFGDRSPEFWELVEALREELKGYAEEFPAAVRKGDLQTLAQLRHMHRPLTINLGLDRLRALESQTSDEIRSRASPERLEELSREFSVVARKVAQGLEDLVPPK